MPPCRVKGRFVMKKLLTVVTVVVLALLTCGCSQQNASSSSALSSAASQSSSGSIDGNVKSYTITRVDGQPDWNSIAQLDIDDSPWTDSFGISAHAQLCHDDQALYVHMWAEEQDIRATYTAEDLLANPFEDSCLEFFLSPVADDARYLNFEFNPNCALCNEIGAQKQDRPRLLPTSETLNASSSRTPDGWEITYQVPFDYIRTLYPAFNPEPGMRMRGNFYKCGNLTANKHYLAWNHVDSETPNFHVPESFGTLVIE